MSFLQRVESWHIGGVVAVLGAATAVVRHFTRLGRMERDIEEIKDTLRVMRERAEVDRQDLMRHIDKPKG